MIHKNIPAFILILSILLINSCGPSEEEKQRREQARQDSLEQLRQDSLNQLRQQRQDSIAQARTDNSTDKKQNNRAQNISFSSNGAFAIQVASWRSRQKAQTEANKWKERGFEQATVVQYGDTPTGDIWFRVRLGHVNSREAAEQVQATLRDDYQTQSWIVSN